MDGAGVLGWERRALRFAKGVLRRWSRPRGVGESLVEKLGGGRGEEGPYCLFVKLFSTVYLCGKVVMM